MVPVKVDSECPPLRGITVALEPLVADHADELIVPLADPSLWTYADTPVPDSLEGLRARYRRLERRASPDGREWWLNWAVRAGADAIGFVEASVRADETRIAIAYALGRASWGRGYATDATRTMLAFLSTRFPTARVEAIVDERNVPSLRLLERLAFTVVDNADSRNLRLRRSDGPHVALRHAVAADIEALVELFARVVDERLWLGTEPGFDRRRIRDNYARTMNDAAYLTLVAESNGELIGTLRLTPQESAHGLGMLIADGFRARGTGRLLVDAAVMWARSQAIEKIALGVFPHNTAARRLYEKAGFIEVSRRDIAYIRQTGDAWGVIEMSKSIPSR
jgi:RimJ/RimL family protein N-acetyltransferase